METSETSPAAQRGSKRIWIFAVLAVVLAAFVVPAIVGGHYATRQTAQRTFTLDDDFTKVRKILVRTDGAKQIVTMAGDSEFVDQKWETVGGELDALKLLDSDWKIQLNGKLRVKSKDKYVGEPVVSLTQTVVIEPDFLDSQTKLIKPAERLRDYGMKTRFERDASGKTLINLELTQEILTHAPWFAHSIADRRVKESASRALAHQEAAIRRLIAENQDKAGLFPLR